MGEKMCFALILVSTFCLNRIYLQLKMCLSFMFKAFFSELTFFFFTV